MVVVHVITPGAVIFLGGLPADVTERINVIVEALNPAINEDILAGYECDIFCGIIVHVGDPRFDFAFYGGLWTL